MSESLGEVRAGLLAATEHLDSARQHAARAGILIGDAVAQLAQLSEQHSESLVPAELQRGADQLDSALQVIYGGVMAVADIEGRL